MVKKFDPCIIANTFLKIAEFYKKPIDQMALQKFVYFAHGLSFKRRGDGLINAPFQAFPFGPLCVDIWFQTRTFGTRKIPFSYRLSIYDPYSSGKEKVQKILDKEKDRDEVELVHEVWEKYNKMNSKKLSDLTHIEGSPWDMIWKEDDFSSHRKYKEIPDEQIKDRKSFPCRFARY